MIVIIDRQSQTETKKNESYRNAPKLADIRYLTLSCFDTQIFDCGTNDCGYYRQNKSQHINLLFDKFCQVII